MKKFLFLILLSSIALNAFSQKQNISDVLLRYDTNFRPYIEAKVSNYGGYKNITSIEFIIRYDSKYSSEYHFEEKQVRTFISAGGSSDKISFYIPNMEYFSPVSIGISRVRFEDGSMFEFPRYNMKVLNANR